MNAKRGLKLKQVIVGKLGDAFTCRIDEAGIRCGKCLKGLVEPVRGSVCSGSRCKAVVIQVSWWPSTHTP